MGISASARLRSAKFLLLTVVLVYTVNQRTVDSGDTLPTRYLPLSMLRELNFDLDEFPFLYEIKLPYFLLQSKGHIVSAYPPWPALLAAPVYLLPVLGGISPRSHLLSELEKLAATGITALFCSYPILHLAAHDPGENRLAYRSCLRSRDQQFQHE